MKRKLFLATFAVVSIAGCSKKVEKISNPCDVHELLIHSLQIENMKLGSELDSMILKYDHGFAFTK